MLSLAITRLQPLMTAAAQIGEKVDQQLLDQLTGWDGSMRADLAEPLIFTAWLREAVRAIYHDDLGFAFVDRFCGLTGDRADPALGGRARRPRLVRRPHHLATKRLRCQCSPPRWRAR